MRITNLFERNTTPACCGTGLAHCHGTLVLHADGTVECEDVEVCGGDELQHELWVACDELGCGCVGDEEPLVAGPRLAA